MPYTGQYAKLRIGYNKITYWI